MCKEKFDSGGSTVTLFLVLFNLFNYMYVSSTIFKEDKGFTMVTAVVRLFNFPSWNVERWKILSRYFLQLPKATNDEASPTHGRGDVGDA
jgi:hypothetical protein